MTSRKRPEGKPKFYYRAGLHRDVVRFLRLQQSSRNTNEDSVERAKDDDADGRNHEEDEELEETRSLLVM